ncbi:hypothetical protein GCM10025875_32370 [Litorihabitans aurantiacus]|uniref:EamA domain-containing protein n=1 Tax=Litorihabitans aurantiacus TaxID=1930061 RepID=A0AA37XIP1_9MICO|nr:hypothetical protein GCM10025875_32370 [Litorihabitans aurantiacus]
MWSALVVPLPALALSWAVEGGGAIAAGLAAFGWRPALSTLYTAGLCTLVGYAIWNALLGRNRSAAVVPWVLLAPVVAMASAATLLGQRPNAAETVGGAVLVAGVLVTMLRPRGLPRRRGAADQVVDGAGSPSPSPSPHPCSHLRGTSGRTRSRTRSRRRSPD